jgi:hypothetical protein
LVSTDRQSPLLLKGIFLDLEISLSPEKMEIVRKVAKSPELAAFANLLSQKQ